MKEHRMKGQVGAVGRALVAGATALSMTAAPMAAQTRENGRWTRVERLEPGARIEVLMQDGRSVTGLFEGTTAEGLVVAVQGGAGLAPAAGSRLDRDDIREIRRAGSSRRWWGAALGGGGGFFAGFIGALNVAVRDCGDSCTDERWIVGALLVAVPVASAVVGYLLGRRHDVVYRAAD
jgi:hypothetical protein